MLIYLDNCCYNRPYDNQSFITIALESQAKLFIQDLVKKNKLQLVTSYVLEFENSENPFEMRKTAISKFICENETVYVSSQKHNDIIAIAKTIEETGVKHKDACHLACALLAKCDYFLTTDKRLLKYQTKSMKIVNPIDFVKDMEDFIL